MSHPANDPCYICGKCVRVNSRSVTCRICERKVHVKCEKTLSIEAILIINDATMPTVCYVCSGCGNNVNEKQKSDNQETETTKRLDSLEVEQRSMKQLILEAKDLLDGLAKNASQPRRPKSELKMNKNRVNPNSISNLTVPEIIEPMSKVKVNFNVPPEPRKRQNSDELTIICSNVPESTATSLKVRHEEDMAEWQKVCHLMGHEVLTVSLVRLSRPFNSPLKDTPRLLKVTLKSASEVESILLSAHLLNGKSPVRAFPDIPWSERKVRKNNPELHEIHQAKKTVLVHGVPESTHISVENKRSHDKQEWSFVQELLGVTGIVTRAISRIPYSANYLGSAPRVMKITTLNDEMANKLFKVWKSHKRLLPPGLKFAPYEVKNAKGTSETRSTTSICSPKNSMQPVETRPASN